RSAGFGKLRRNDLLRGRDLRDHRLEARIEQRADVELARLVARDDLLGDVLGLFVADITGATQVDDIDDLLRESPAQDVIALAADTDDLDRLAGRDQRVRAIPREPRDRGVEGAAKTALGR